MIFCEYFSPMPGRASSWSLLAELMSIKSAFAAADMAESDFDIFELLVDLVSVACAAATLAKSTRANSETTIQAIRFLRFIVSP